MSTFYLQLFFLPFIGFFLGILSMLYGLGGGVIIIPAVFLFLKHLGYDPEIAMEIAVGTSMLNVFASTVTASWRHYRQGNTLWNLVYQFAPFIIIGAIIGVVLVHHFSGEQLRRVFIAFLAYILFHSLFNRNFKQPWKMEDYRPPSIKSTGIVGIMIGALSVLVGVGGGTLIIPYLRAHRMPMLQATAMSATVAPMLAFVGSLGYFGVHLNPTPPYTYGSINLPIFACIFVGSSIGVFYGEIIGKYFDEAWRTKSFPILIAVILAMMII